MANIPDGAAVVSRTFTQGRSWILRVVYPGLFEACGRPIDGSGKRSRARIIHRPRWVSGVCMDILESNKRLREVFQACLAYPIAASGIGRTVTQFRFT